MMICEEDQGLSALVDTYTPIQLCIDRLPGKELVSNPKVFFSLRILDVFPGS
jgi:hypothetical protein